MDRQDAEKEVRAIGRTCRGPHVVKTALVVAALVSVAIADREKRRTFLDHPENDPAEIPPGQLGPDGDATWLTPARARELYALASPASVATALLEEGYTQAASFVDSIARGKGCGADFNDIICAGALDGGTYAYECPKCGATGEYTAPVFDLDETSVFTPE